MDRRFLEVKFFTYYHRVIDFVTVNKNVPGNFSIGTKRPPESNENTAVPCPRNLV